jgi:hypothetical protein
MGSQSSFEVIFGNSEAHLPQADKTPAAPLCLSSLSRNALSRTSSPYIQAVILTPRRAVVNALSVVFRSRNA